MYVHNCKKVRKKKSWRKVQRLRNRVRADIQGSSFGPTTMTVRAHMSVSETTKGPGDRRLHAYWTLMWVRSDLGCTFLTPARICTDS